MMGENTTDYSVMKPVAVEAIQESSRWAMAKLGNELRNVKQLIPKLRDGKPVLEGFLDLYMHNEIAAEHLLGGLSKRWREFYFLSDKGLVKVR